MSFLNLFGGETAPSEEPYKGILQGINSITSHDTDEDRQMTQDEVNRLVHDALRRARKATSPRKRVMNSPNSMGSTTSPHSIDSSRASTNMSPASLPSPHTSTGTPKPHFRPRASDLPSNHPHHSDSRTNRHSGRKTSDSARNRVSRLQDIVGAASSDPSQGDMDSLLSPTMDSIENASSAIASVNSSDSVLRRVEEEIANARKAAREAENSRSRSPEIVLSPTQELSGILDDHLADDADLHNILDTKESEDMLDSYYEKFKNIGPSFDEPEDGEHLELDYVPQPEDDDDDAGDVFDDDSEFAGLIDDSEFDANIEIDDSSFQGEGVESPEDWEVAVINKNLSSASDSCKQPFITPQTSEESPTGKNALEADTAGSEDAIVSPDETPLEGAEAPEEGEVEPGNAIAYPEQDYVEGVEVGLAYVGLPVPSPPSYDSVEEKKFDVPSEDIGETLKERDDFIGVVDEPDWIERSPRNSPTKTSKTSGFPPDEEKVHNGNNAVSNELTEILASGSVDSHEVIDRYASVTQDSDDIRGKSADEQIAESNSEYTEQTVTDDEVERIGSEVIMSKESSHEDDCISEVESDYTEETVEEEAVEVVVTDEGPKDKDADAVDKLDSSLNGSETVPTSPRPSKSPVCSPKAAATPLAERNLLESTPKMGIGSIDQQEIKQDDISKLDTPLAGPKAAKLSVDTQDTITLQQPKLTPEATWMLPPREASREGFKRLAGKKAGDGSLTPSRLGNAENFPPKTPLRTQKPPTPKQSSVPLGPSRKIQFRHPYPYPPPLAQPRSDKDVITDNQLGIPPPFTKWFKAKPDLQQLLMAACGDSLHRRSNACGALKVLSQQTKNQLALVRTKGFLDALVFAISARIPNNNQDTDIALDARGRAVTTLLNVADPKDNRQIVMVHPGVGDCLLRVIEDDEGEARVQACATLAVLAKTPGNREFMARVDRLLDVMGQVLLGSIDDVEPKTSMEGYHHSDTDESDGETDEDDEASSVRGSKSFSTAGDGQSTFDDGETAMSVGLSSSTSSIRPPPSKNRNKSKSIRMQKDDMHDEFLKQARVNACATLMHLSKHCAISHLLVANNSVVGSLVEVSREFDNPIHTKCIEMICNLTRFPSNLSCLARNDTLIETLMKCGKSKVLADRVWAMRCFQNISSDSTSKVILANARILTLLSICSMRSDYDEQLAATSALYNLSTEPGAVVPLTNTRNVVATLVHLAHSSGSTPQLRNLACDSLATIGLWLQTLAGSGTIPANVETDLLPSHQTTGWQRWD